MNKPKTELVKYLEKNFPEEKIVGRGEAAAIRVLKRYREHLSGLYTWQRWEDHFKRGIG